MILSLYQITDAENVINKTLSLPVNLNINFKANVDIVSPEIILLDNGTIDYNEYNYAFITELNRFYFVTDARKVNNKLVQLDLHCDVLETYKADILASNARFMRNIRTGDYYAGDLDYSTLKVVAKFESNKTLVSGEESMILTTIGGNANG